MVKISSWGRLENVEHEVYELRERELVGHLLKTNCPGIAYGMGRSYGDICLNPGGKLWKTTAMDRFISFDEVTGRLVCEAGVLLRDIQQLMVPRGWILPVTPGTQLVTVGGAVANDVHGKNHHLMGCFGNHIQRIRLIRTDGTLIDCGPNLHSEWFAATVGGMGLTGVITEVDIQLKKIASPWLNIETMPFANLNQFFQMADSSVSAWEHTAAWIDCLSVTGNRGIFMRGNSIALDKQAPYKERKLTIPLVPPISLINKLSLRAFNSLYFNVNKRKAGSRIVHYEPFLYPLDNVQKWNRIYGPKGFYQYQCVIPHETGADAIKAMLEEIMSSKSGSFLAVLKTFGNYPALGMLSFAQPGVTLALDFPNRGNPTHVLFRRLDAIVEQARGRIYLAKDARMPRQLFESGYPRLNEFLTYRDPGISSAMSRRLIGN